MPSLYPPSPTDVPLDLTNPSAQYRQQMAFVVGALGLFFVLYFGIMALCALFMLWAVASLFLVGFHRNLAGLALLQLLFCLPTLLLFIYLLKNLFRFGGQEKTDDLEIFADEHPQLFEFIYRVCDETGAPYPRRVFVNHAVNAMAISDGNSFWHLFIPTDKHLVIGLGLVNAVNLTEFKALLAHEFGHFSQKSTKLGAYVYTAFGIINQIVEGRDFFDRFIEGWCRRDPWLAFPAHLIYGVLWLLRQALGGLRYTIFYFHRGLGRQMEFNADLVAVSVTGSDAPVHLLYRTVFADRCLNQSIQDLQTARDHRLYTADLFFHQSHAASYLRQRAEDPRLGEPPALPIDPARTTTVFDPDDEEQADTWSTHPSNHDRERNAKAFYLRSAFDERSPWLLFDNVGQLRSAVTYQFYRSYFKTRKDTPLAEPEEVQAFVDDERAETTYDPRYQGLYDYRSLVLGDVYELAREARQTPWTVAQLSGVHAGLYNVEVKHRGQLHNQRLAEHSLLLAVAKGWHKPKHNEVDFRGERYPRADAKRLLKKVDKELARDQDWLAELDRRVFMTYFPMALQLSQETAEDLFRRYRFHLDLQKIWRLLKDQEAPVDAAVHFLQSATSNEVDAHVLREALTIFRDAHHALREALQWSEDMTIPALKNMRGGLSLRKFLLEHRLVDGVSAYDHSLSMKWVTKLLNQLRQVQQKVDRVHFKSLGGILALQERIGEECAQRWTALPAIVPVPPSQN